ncbi:PDR/VanB family oxidoreductase [Nocardiopsis sp. RSe5-2]|uniref:PDR/VanB family oxidoreductase n=1 Tax=Nocardiopsis endophytica TaxID=3018445 RepID=A0ABT4U8F6_9ACTN|nr:PDR/VanB family oxidoreductase [Nocardiopsis endophytica]MDA2813243.1 PDR/VanB family oxidoreductase [Nocardiopsis endophytica]
MAVDTQADWQDGEVVEAAPAADGIQRIVLRPERPRPAAPGAHVDVAVEIDGRTDTRSYSVVRGSEDGGLLTISVQLAADSRGGSRFMHTLRPGDGLRMTQPLQNFPLRIGAPRYVLVAGGIGITAIAAMADVLRRLKADYVLVYVGRGRDRMAYLEELVERHGDRIRVHVDDEGTPLDASALVDGVAGAGPAELYMCGPIRLMDAVRRRWHDRGLPAADLRYETFGNSGWYDPEEFEVEIPRLGVRTVVGGGRSMLEALEQAGAEVISDCRKGECGLCQVRVLDVQGLIDHRDVFFSDEEKRTSPKMCACVSRAVCAPRPDGAPGPSGVEGRRALLTIDIP